MSKPMVRFEFFFSQNEEPISEDIMNIVREAYKTRRVQTPEIYWTTLEGNDLSMQLSRHWVSMLAHNYSLSTAQEIGTLGVRILMNAELPDEGHRWLWYDAGQGMVECEPRKLGENLIPISEYEFTNMSRGYYVVDSLVHSVERDVRFLLHRNNGAAAWTIWRTAFTRPEYVTLPAFASIRDEAQNVAILPVVTRRLFEHLIEVRQPRTYTSFVRLYQSFTKALTDVETEYRNMAPPGVVPEIVLEDFLKEE